MARFSADFVIEYFAGDENTIEEFIAEGSDDDLECEEELFNEEDNIDEQPSSAICGSSASFHDSSYHPDDSPLSPLSPDHSSIFPDPTSPSFLTSIYPVPTAPRSTSTSPDPTSLSVSPGPTSISTGHTSASPSPTSISIGHTSAFPGPTSISTGHTSASPDPTSISTGHTSASPSPTFISPGISPVPTAPVVASAAANFEEEPDWQSTATPVAVSNFSGPAYGPTQAIPPTHLEIFQLFFTDDLCDLIVKETNRYANQVRSSKGQSTDWETNRAEIKAYLGFAVLMGINRLPELRDYWSNDPLLHYAPIAGRISRNRFEEIIKYLHFVDNSILPSRGQPGYSRTQKFNPVLLAVNDRLEMMWNPSQNLSIDEAMIPFKGRSSMKQYIPLKPIKRGFKIWVLADAKNGYFYHVTPYVGSIPSEDNSGLGPRVVMQLATPLLGRFHCLYMDNFFSSVALYRRLLHHNTYACGTIRKGRKKFPKDLLEDSRKMKRGEYKFRQDGNITTYAWKDTKVVTAISNCCAADDVTTVQRRQKDTTSASVPCPTAIKLYNQHMGGVDKGDQLRNYYLVRLKSRKNYKYFFWFLFEVCLINSYIVSAFSPTTTLPFSQYNLKSYRLELARQLIGDYNSRKRPGRRRQSSSSSASSAGPPTSMPRLSHVPSHEGNKHSRCVYCRTRRNTAKRSHSVWVCRACPGMPTLCLKEVNGDSCFKLWHNLQQEI